MARAALAPISDGMSGSDFRIERQDVDDDLHLVVEAFREQRTHRPVDQARGQRLELARACLRA